MEGKWTKACGIGTFLFIVVLGLAYMIATIIVLIGA